MEERLNDTDYKNWVFATLGMLFTKEGLEQFVDAKSSELHNQICRVLGHQTCIDRNCRDKLTSALNRNKSDILCSVCSRWLDAIATFCENSSSCLSPQNTNHRLWQSDKWEVVKLYMARGSAGDKSPNDADIADMLKLFLNCTLFRQPNIKGLSQELLDKRNTVIHSGNMRVDTTFLTDLLDKCLQLLRAIPTSPNVQEAIAKICELQTNDLYLASNSNDEFRALEEEIVSLNSRVHQLEADIDSIQTTHSGEISRLNNEQQRVQTEYSDEIQNLTTKNRELQETIDADESFTLIQELLERVAVLEQMQ